MKKKHKYIVAAAIAAVLTGTAYLAKTGAMPAPIPTPSVSAHVGTAALYPDANLSPGLVATQSFADLTQTSSCGTYSKCHRATTSAQKDQVRSEYPGCPPAPESEIDHIVPLALGGADDVKNLWCQPAINQWNGQDYGFHTKDKLEAYLAIQVKSGAISPIDAQDCILSDWVSCYVKYLGGNSFGSTGTADPDVQ